MYVGSRAKWQARVKEYPILFALCFSLLLHLGIFGVIHFFPRILGLSTPTLTKQLKQMMDRHVMTVVTDTKKPLPKEAEVNREVPLMFVEVDPSQVVKEPPKNAKYYSSQSTLAANPNPMVDKDQPRIDGKQERVIKTIDVLRPAPPSKAQPLQPSPPKEQTASTEPPEPQTKPLPPNNSPIDSDKPEKTKAKGGQEAGDLVMAKPSLKPDPTKPPGEEVATPPPRSRPRTLQEARARQENSQIAGERMKQDGGVKRPSIVSSLDTKGSLLGDYDGQLIQAIQFRWNSLLDERKFSDSRSGKVVIEFRLRYDGAVTDLKIVEENVGDILAYICAKAIQDPSKYPPWPPDVRKMIGDDHRDVRFTFYYN